MLLGVPVKIMTKTDIERRLIVLTLKSEKQKMLLGVPIKIMTKIDIERRLIVLTLKSEKQKILREEQNKAA